LHRREGESTPRRTVRPEWREDAMMTWKTMKTLTTGAMAVFGTVFVMGNTAPTCVPLDEPEMQVLCLQDEECANLDSELDCLGEWACEEGSCVFHCDDPEPPPTECQSDSDCGSGQHCEIVDCWAPPCDDDGPCALCCMPIGECVDDDPGECFDDGDCPDGFYCDPIVWFGEELPCDGDNRADEPLYAPVGQGQCLPLPQPECINDADCDPGFVCELLDDCVPLPCDFDDGDMGCEEIACMPYGVCVPDEEPEELCYSSEECDKGQICSVELGDCLPMPGCEDGMGCPTVCLGVCVDLPEPECFDDSDCPPGFACEFMDGPGACDCDPDDEFCLMYDCMAMGQCVPSEIEGDCDDDADCGPDAFCLIEEVCAVNCFCDGDDCPEEMECFLFGTCIPDGPFPGECMSDADCLYGQVCELMDVDCYDDCKPGDEYCAGDCAPFGICIDVPVPPQSECLYDDDCKDGQICDLTEGPYPCDCDPEDDYCLMMYCMPIGFCIDAPEPPNPCQPTGCSGQLCSAVDIGTTCEWLPHYACFQDAICGSNGPNSACAWEHTDELSACLAMYLSAP